MIEIFKQKYKFINIDNIQLLLFQLWFLFMCIFEDNELVRKYVWILLLLFILFEFINIFKTKKINFNVPIVCVFMFAIFCTLSASWAINYKISLIAGRSVSILAIFLLISYNYFRRIPNGLEKLLKSIAFVGIAFSIFIILYYSPIMYFKRIISGERVGMEIANVNSIGMKVIVSFIICIFYAIFKSQKKYYLLSLFPLIVSIGCGSRKTIVFAGISILFILIYYVIKPNSKKVKRIALCLFFVLLVLITLLYFFKVPFVVIQISRVVEMINGILGLGEADHSTMLRISYIKIGIDQFLKKPIFGIGIDNARLINIRPTYLHNNFFELLASVGIIGFLLYYSIYFIIFYYFIKNRKKFDEYYLICFCIIINIFILDYGLVSYYSKTTYIYFLMCFLVLNINNLEINISSFIQIIKKIILKLMDLGFFNFMSDKQYIKFRYYLIFDKKLNLENPKTFNEKLQWLKLYNYKEDYTTMIDKFLVKEYISNTIGDEYIIPTLGVYNTFDEINFDELPNSFVVKCTHDSGGLIIVKNKKALNIKNARKKINKCLRKNYYYIGREIPYKYIKPRIIIEKYMNDKNDELRDYKFFCFSGKVELILVCSDRSTKVKFTFFDKNGKFINVKQCGEDNDPKVNLPKNFDKMKKIAEKLSHDMIHVRVDFYEIDGKIYFGELTFFDSSGFGYFSPDKWDKILGDMLVLPLEKQ